MLVKKIPYFQGFPRFSEVSDFLREHTKKSYDCPCFYDIETTGLSAAGSFVYLIGAVTMTESGWMLCQWFAQNPDEEIMILKEFSCFLENCGCTIQYNGDQFDQPFLEQRYAIHKLPSPFVNKASLDLYKWLRPLKHLLNLTGMKQTDLEAFLGICSRNFSNGKDCIRCYRRYLKKPSDVYAGETMGHNREDLSGLGQIFSMLRYLSFYEGYYHTESCLLQEERLIFVLNLPEALPVAFSAGSEHFYITAEKQRAAVSFPCRNGRVRNYYPNPRDYVYLPEEDTVIPKALSSGIARSKCQPAKPQTCYTWFACSESFLSDINLQETYLKKNLKILLSFI